MAINLPIVLNPAAFPAGYCPTSWQQLANDLAQLTTGYLEGNYSTFNYGPTTPGVNDRSKPWLRTTASGLPDSWYVYGGSTVAAWIWPHPVAALSDFRVMYAGSAVSITTLDGGDSNPIGDASGPFWEIDTAFESRSPMGVAAVISGTATPFPVGTNYGEAQHTLTSSELPSHAHTISAGTTLDVNGGGTRTLFGTDDAAIFTTTRNSGSVGSDAAHNTVHPVRAVYMLKRTARIYKKAP